MTDDKIWHLATEKVKLSLDEIKLAIVLANFWGAVWYIKPGWVPGALAAYFALLACFRGWQFIRSGKGKS